MATPHEAPQTSPLRIFETLNAYQQPFALKAGIELDLFTRIAEGLTTAPQLAKAATASDKGIRILCDFLVIIGFLTKSGSSYGLAPDAALFLDKKSPAYLGSIALFLAHPSHITNYLDLTEVVRKGGTTRGQGNMGPENPIWVEFARSMAPISGLGAPPVADIVTESGKALKVLDISAGPGNYGVEIAKRNPQSQIHALDWKNVLEVSVERAREAGVGGQYHTIPGSAFDVEFGPDYDVVLLPNFLHHFDAATNVKLLRKIHAALKPGGRCAIVEFTPNEDRISPPQAAAFSMMMLGSTETGDAYTVRELDAMLRDAGFSGSTAHELPPSPQTLVLGEY